MIWNLFSFAQVRPSDKYDCYTLDLNKNNEAGLKIPYHSINISDERPDTSKAGYLYPWENNKGVKKICFKNGMHEQLSSFFNSYLQYNSESEISLLACVKNLWFGTYDTTDIKENKLTVRTKKLAIRIEFYKKDQNCYYPLYRFDSTFNMSEMPGKKPSAVLEMALVASLKRLEKNYYLNNSALKCLSGQQIDSFNNVSKNFPVLKEQIAKKGVYMTVGQFRSNLPAYTEFTLKLSRERDELFVKGIEGPSPINPWAVSTGEKMYIRLAQNYFQIFRSGYTYDFFGYDTFFSAPTSNPNTTPLGVTLLNLMTAKQTHSRPYQVNLETGEIY